MTESDFFRALIKALGLYLLGQFIFFGATGLPLTLFSLQYREVNVIIASVIAILLILGLIYLLLFQTEKIVTLLKLNKGFDNEIINTNLKSSDIIKLSILLIGGYLSVIYIFPFLYNIVILFKEICNHIAPHNKTYYSVLHNGTNLLIGFLLVFNIKRISNYLDSK